MNDKEHLIKKIIMVVILLIIFAIGFFILPWNV